MTIATTAPKVGMLNLENAGLLVPALQSEPLPIRRIDTAPCTTACPAGINVKAYVSMIAERRFADALEMVRRRCPLPGICGRVCDHPCEVQCTRARFDEPIAIRALKRFVADLELAGEIKRPPLPTKADPRPQKIAIIGSGPAGITAAYDLALSGYPVTIFESESAPGGMLRYGIVCYRLPREIIDGEFNMLCEAGVELKTGVTLGKDIEIDGLLKDGFSSVLLAVGAQKGKALGIPGEEDCSEIEDALAFLRRVNDGDRTPVEGKVVVIGGGSTAIEAARTALRLGASSSEIVYRRYREEMPAGDLEIKDAEEEGVKYRFLVTPTRVIVKGGKMTGIECVKIGLGEPDASGRRGPIMIPGSEFTIEADRVLAAVSQVADLSFVPKNNEMMDGRWLSIDDATAMTPRAGVFAAGDVVTGPATVIKAIDAGHKAAKSIRRFIEEGKAGIPTNGQRPADYAEYELPDIPPVDAQRVWPKMVWPKQGSEFNEVESAFTHDQAVNEARRCMRCGPCDACKVCAPSCRRRYIMLSAPKNGGTFTGPTAFIRASGNVAMGLNADHPTPGWLLPVIRPGALGELDTSLGMEVGLLPGRVYINEERCRGCGLCVEVCPFDALSLKDSEHGGKVARLEASLCRGCNPCTSVCPTDAITAGALSPDWWKARLEETFADVDAVGPGPIVVLACERRYGNVDGICNTHGVTGSLIRFRCTGQIDAGMLLDVCHRGAGGILVAGCDPVRCRFGSGAKMAEGQVERAKAMLRTMGEDDSLIVCDWAKGPADDAFEEPLARVIATARERGATATATK
ncbi:MAG: FAD-dependent oxidoreductase [Phycisphaerae bacterium]|jgi:NADPH-dependent glutamate synthase beta subunit-like oxidoreductase/coenzyme F420-reducing hydrogenase delta subunit/NAD-dependent dihydropyrimidine dehydrogenase PreA subunit